MNNTHVKMFLHKYVFKICMMHCYYFYASTKPIHQIKVKTIRNIIKYYKPTHRKQINVVTRLDRLNSLSIRDNFFSNVFIFTHSRSYRCKTLPNDANGIQQYAVMASLILSSFTVTSQILFREPLFFRSKPYFHSDEVSIVGTTSTQEVYCIAYESIRT